MDLLRERGSPLRYCYIVLLVENIIITLSSSPYEGVLCYIEKHLAAVSVLKKKNTLI